MNQRTLPYIDKNECEQTLRKTLNESRFKLDESLICAGGGAKEDTCEGDGGGPLVCPMNKYQNRTVQIGITAGGIGCGKPGIPGLYASVSDGICFIKHAIECYVSE